MSDETTKPAANSITLSFGDPKVWAVIAALVGGQFAANKLSLSGVENQQERVADTAKEAAKATTSIDEKLQAIKAAQHEFQGEMRYRLEQSEKRMRDLQDSIDTKKGSK
jgi:hypothetical protein